jgi:hypothetical protein
MKRGHCHPSAHLSQFVQGSISSSAASVSTRTQLIPQRTECRTRLLNTVGSSASRITRGAGLRLRDHAKGGYLNRFTEASRSPRARVNSLSVHSLGDPSAQSSRLVGFRFVVPSGYVIVTFSLVQSEIRSMNP